MKRSTKSVHLVKSYLVLHKEKHSCITNLYIIFFFSYISDKLTCLNKLFALSTIVFGRLIRSAIVFISRNAFIRALSVLLMFLLFWYFDTPKLSKEASPRPGPMIVERSPPDRSGFSGPPTRDGSTPDFSLLKVRHSEPTSITLKCF